MGSLVFMVAADGRPRLGTMDTLALPGSRCRSRRKLFNHEDLILSRPLTALHNHDPIVLPSPCGRETL